MSIDQVFAKADSISILGHVARDPLEVDVIVMNGLILLYQQGVSDLYLSNFRCVIGRFERKFSIPTSRELNMSRDCSIENHTQKQALNSMRNLWG